jgi:hypothetical protein
VNSAPKKKKLWFTRLESREDALLLIRQSVFGFWTLAVIQGCVGFFLTPRLFYDAILFAALAGVLMRWKSRVAAVLLALFSAAVFASTILNLLNVTQQEGTNIVLATIFAFATIRAVETTFKLHGRFKDDGGKPIP